MHIQLKIEWRRCNCRVFCGCLLANWSVGKATRDNEAAYRVQQTTVQVHSWLVPGLHSCKWAEYFPRLCTHACWHTVNQDRDCVIDLKNNFKQPVLLVLTKECERKVQPKCIVLSGWLLEIIFFIVKVILTDVLAVVVDVSLFCSKSSVARSIVGGIFFNKHVQRFGVTA